MKLNFNTEDEAEAVEEIFNSAIQCLSEEDRALSPVGYFLPMLKKGIAVHHSGLLPILKEVVEILFQEGMIKARGALKPEPCNCVAVSCMCRYYCTHTTATCSAVNLCNF